MTTEIHAHNVLNLLREQALSEQELRNTVVEEFGEAARFRTCKLDGFDFDALFAFFVQRKKIIEQDGKWHINAERVCNH
ncbi:DUF2492 family protein [Vibrio sinensis]|uniref:DUF2492 family protein n=1 Tax=Vibrio sinensis TaxID=2302434 RepID=A0A3A6QJF7_9VIBR|nr:YecH family metal-binding protein [Vibrio sinensis]RJX65274.1 DUF2492 family protein [Vibrio sinensis]